MTIVNRLGQGRKGPRRPVPTCPARDPGCPCLALANGACLFCDHVVLVWRP